MGRVLTLDSRGSTSTIADAFIALSGQRFVMRADEKLTAFMKLEATIRTLAAALLRRF